MLAVTNGHVLTMADSAYDRGTVVIDGDKIVAVGGDLAIPDGAHIIDASGKWVLPGFVESHSHVGIWGEGVAWEGRDFNETSEPVTPHMRAIDAINPFDMAIPMVRAAGITTLLTGPGSANLIGGEWAAIKPIGRTVEEMVLRYPCGLKMALGENPKQVYGNQHKSPVTRMGEAALIREAFVRAERYAAERERAEANESEPPARDLRLEPLVRALRREERTRIHAHAAQDIVTAVRLSREFGLDPVIEHGTEAYKVADFLAREGVPVSAGPFHLGRPKLEMAPMTFENPARLAEAGVLVAIHMDTTGSTILLPIFAALAVRAGMPEDAALRAITINAAIVAGVADRVGSLEAGKDADLQILSGHPFELMTRPEQVFINGELVFDEARRVPGELD